ncbi:Crp/Fnr family transcriptional regulator [Sphingomonas spermidinifaciens]|uniref:Crp/Fnr family transcriptional regulator n=1 Tax=Sphingomonas spermidinifaciens TaxID=1141889 RepID=UPI001FE68211|nr:Crp/Fnr family transcriptional regulator [Sphingomonas spermidinifaciens]
MLGWSEIPAFFRRSEPILRQGDAPTRCAILRRGLACRWKMNSDGGRQIVSLHYPGDLLDLQHFLLERADHHISALTSCDLSWVSYEDLQQTVEQYPAVGRALWRYTLAEASVSREWLLNVGRRDALQRVAHLLVELHLRTTDAGMAATDAPTEALTQEDIADATGLTAVHVNRMIQRLRSSKALPERGKLMTTEHLQRLKEFAVFDGAYLHHLTSKRSAVIG